LELKELHILNFKNIHEADLCLNDKLNCFVGLNGQGKTNVLDAIYLLSFTKSAFSQVDSLNITHDQDVCLVQGVYESRESIVDSQKTLSLSYGLKRGAKKTFRLGDKPYKRLIDHIGLVPLVMVSPEDGRLVEEGSDERRRFMDLVICQQNKTYLEQLTRYNALLKQRNALLKQLESMAEQNSDGDAGAGSELLETYETQMIPLAEYIFEQRSKMIEAFVPLFQSLYEAISGGAERCELRYVSQLQDRALAEAYPRTRQRDLILGWTSQGIHKDDISMLLDGHDLKKVGSQGQQKTYLLAMKLAQAVYLGKPILLLDDIFDKLDSERVSRIIQLVQTDRFGQIFITDTDRQHLTQLLQNTEAKVFYVEKGRIIENG